MLTIPPDLKIRRARDNDLPEMARIHSVAYVGANMDFDQRIAHFRDDPRLPLENHWICEKNGQLMGMFALYNFKMYRFDSLIPAGGIGRVAVSPEARKSGIAYWMMVKAVQIMDQNGFPLSILYPFKHVFYRRLGWGLVGRSLKYRIPVGNLTAWDERSNVRLVRVEDEQQGVMLCYNDYARNHNGLLERSDAVWMEQIFKNSLCYSYLDANGKVSGYLVCTFQAHDPETDYMASDLLIKELVWTDPESFRGLIGFIAAQSDQVRSVDYNDQTGISLEYILNDPRMSDGIYNAEFGVETARIGSGLMGRIVQVRRSLTAARFGTGSGKVTLKITDEVHPENSEPVKLEFDKGAIQFLKQGDTPFTLHTDMATFSSIYWGRLALKEAVFLNLVQIEGKGDASFLSRAFSVQHPMCLDYF